MPKRIVPLVCVVVVCTFAVAVRYLPRWEWPDARHESVQYETALAARHVWIQFFRIDPTPDEVSWATAAGRKYFTSPPVLPALVASTYAMTGGEHPVAFLVFNTLAWLAAGAFVFATTRTLTGYNGAALVCASWFLLTPGGVAVTRCFQVDALLVCGFAFGVWALTRAGACRSWGGAVLTGVGLGAAAFLKPGILLLPIAGGLAWLALVSPRGEPRVRVVAKCAVCGVLAAGPSVAYALLMLRHHVGDKMAPDLLLSFNFYKSLLGRIEEVVGLPALVLAAVGFVVAVRRCQALVGLGLGYVAFCLLFSRHTSTHDYYHAPLLVLVAVLAGHPVANALQRVVALRPPLARRLVAGAGVALAAYFAATNAFDIGVAPLRFQLRSSFSGDRRILDTNELAAVRGAIPAGEFVFALSRDYSFPLAYHGWVHPSNWPVSVNLPPPLRTEQGVECRLRAVQSHLKIRYFVVTDLSDFEAQPALRAVLDRIGQPELRWGSVLYRLTAPSEHNG